MVTIVPRRSWSLYKEANRGSPPFELRESSLQKAIG